MTCCSNPGEILVLPRGRIPSKWRSESADPHGPLPNDIISSWDELFSADVPDEALARNHDLRSSPYVAVVPEEEVEKELSRLRQHPQVITATRNWGVSLTSPIQGLTGVSMSAEPVMFLKRAGLLEPSDAGGPPRGVRVGILDSGVDPNVIQGDALDPMQLDTVALGSALRTNPHDSNGHGSVVASIVNFMAPTAKIVSVRCFGRGPSALSDVIYGLLLSRLIDDSIDVFNLSFSVNVSVERCPNCGHSSITGDDREALRILFEFLRTELDARPLFVAAAGNDGPRVAIPAALDGVIAVGSIGGSDPSSPSPEPKYDEVPEQFVLAPGGTRASPVCRGLRLGTMTTPPFYGTSFATAVATGVVARLLVDGNSQRIPAEANDERTAEVVTRLREKAWTGYSGYAARTHGMGVIKGSSIASRASESHLEW